MNKKIIIGLCMVFLLVGFVSAFAVSSTYWKENPLPISPGETKEIFVTLQNLGGDSNMTVKGISSDSDAEIIIEFIGSSDIYEIPIGTKTQVDFSVTVPEDAVIGETYFAIVSFNTITDSESGGFGFGSSIERKIPLLITAEVKESAKISFSYWWIYLIVVVVLIIVVVLLIKKKRNKK